MIETRAQEIYLSCAFVVNSDLKRYGHLIEELEKDYTKGNDKSFQRNLYAFRQGNLPNPDYLDRFMNLVDMAESYDAKLYDQAMFKIAQDSTFYITTAEAYLQYE